MIEMAKKVVLIDFIAVPERKVGVILNHFPEYSALSLAEPGCLAFTVSHLAGKPTIFVVYEEFDGAKSFAARQARVQASLWGADTKMVNVLTRSLAFKSLSACSRKMAKDTF